MAHLSKKLWGGVWVSIGYLLSPLSWWNDLFFNLPIALVFGYAASWLHASWFVPGTIAGYWLSNVAGMVMMQFGAADIVRPDQPRHLQRDLLVGLGSSTLYTLVVCGLVYWQVLPIPEFLTTLTP